LLILEQLRDFTPTGTSQLEYWNDGIRKKIKNLLFPILIPIIPLFQQPIIPILQKITLMDNGVPLKLRKLQLIIWRLLTFRLRCSSLEPNQQGELSDSRTAILASHHKSPINPENSKKFQLMKPFSGYFRIINIAIETHYIMISLPSIFDKTRPSMRVNNFLRVHEGKGERNTISGINSSHRRGMGNGRRKKEF